MVNDRTPQTPPVIEPLPEGNDKPIWSVMIPTYNCSRFLKASLESVLNQAKMGDEMQIAVIDDFSTDDNVQKIVEEIGKGRVEFYQQTQNVGSLRNFEACIQKARGEYVHLLHGDDIVRPGFYKEIEELFKNNASAGAAFTGLSNIDEYGKVLEHNMPVQAHAGIIQNWLAEISKCQRLQTCSIVVKRKVYEALGSFFGVHYGEDWEMWVRIASKYPVAYSPSRLAFYRVHGDNISSRSLATGDNIKDIKKVIDIIQNYLPAESKKEIKKEARKNFAEYITNNAHKIHRQNRHSLVPLIQAQGAFHLYANKKTLISFLKICMKTLLKYKSKS